MRDLGWILLCDDDETVLEREQELLENYWNETGRDPMPVRVFHRAADVLGENFTEEDSPTLAFLDVYLEDRFTGFDLVRYLRRTAPELLVVIVTGYREKLDEAMDTRVFRFMEKPLEQGYFCRIMDIAEERIRRIRGDFSFQTAGGTKILKSEDVLFMEAQGHRTEIHTREGVLFCTRPFWVCQSMANGLCFAQTHRSYLVNLRYVTRVGKEKVELTAPAQTALNGKVGRDAVSATVPVVWRHYGSMLENAWLDYQLKYR